jgi:ABC-2 type transport system ATP-binding protein
MLHMLDGSASVATLEDVSHRYGSVEALSHLSLALAPAQVTALLGPNGAGKTTVVRLLTGLTRPTQGRATLFGTNPQHPEPRRRLGVMLQVGRVPETLTVREHVQLFSSYYPAPLPLARVLSLAGLEELSERRYGALSGGERQRVQFALAIVGDPALLFLDEPTAAMDVESRRRFWSGIRELAAAGRSILLTTHHLEEADAIANRVVVLGRGRVLADDTPARIKQTATGRKLRCQTRLSRAELRALPGVQQVVEVANELVVLHSLDSDCTVRALLERDASVSQLEIHSAGLEEAFLALTAAGEELAHVG